jgi:hypothetical protein
VTSIGCQSHQHAANLAQDMQTMVSVEIVACLLTLAQEVALKILGKPADRQG